jgi:ABC-type Zn uptake system ZnuABC Zn-binding protein ZnuA
MTRPSLSRRHFTFGVLGTAAVGLVRPVSARQDDGGPAVVATFSILGDWVQRVGGDRLTLTTIVPAGGDTHTFDPVPEQVGAIAGADLIFEIGLGFETWLDGMVEASGTGAARVVVSDGVEVLHFGEDDDHDHAVDEEADHDHEEADHDHGNDDPHIWGDVQNAIIAVGLIRDALAGIDPDHAGTYEANAAAYIAELEELDEFIRTETAAIPADRRKLVTTHDTLGYYAHAYGFEIPGTALGSISTDTGDPSAQAMADLVAAIQASGAPAIFAESTSNNALMETIAEEAGVTLAPPLYTDALGEPGSDGATYVDMMTANTAVIVDALG